MGRRRYRNWATGEWRFPPARRGPPKPQSRSAADPSAWEDAKEFAAAQLAEEEAKIAKLGTDEAEGQDLEEQIADLSLTPDELAEFDLGEIAREAGKLIDG